MLRLRNTGQRPTGPFGINWDSPHAQGLSAWYPMQPSVLNPYLNRPNTPFVPGRTGGITVAAASIGGTAAVINHTGTADGMFRGLTTQTLSVFTVAAWYYQTAISGGDNFLWRFVDAGFVGWYFLDTNGVPKFSVFDGSTTGTAFGTTTNVTNQWQHMVGVEASASSRAVYRNGSGKGTDTTTVGAVVGSATEEIGANAGIGSLTGLIADIRIWNRALSDAEVWSLYDPSMRWDLYWQPNTRAYSFMSAIAAGTAGYLLVKN